MAPIRRNKGKEKMTNDETETKRMRIDDKIELRPSGESSANQGVLLYNRLGESSANQGVVLYNRLSVLVSPTKSVDQFQALFKVSRKTFNYIVSMVRDPMMSQVNKFWFLDGNPMSINDQIAIALRRLSSVDSTDNIASLFGTDHLTAFNVTWRFVEAMERTSAHLRHLLWPSDTARIKTRFERIAGLPNCCGAIQTTHLTIYPEPSEDRNGVWLDRGNNTSMTLQVMADPGLRIIDLVAGWPGCLTDNKVLQKSKFFDLAQKGERLSNEIELSDGTKLREYIVGGLGYQLLPWLITPYPDEKLSEDRFEFNRRHLATRLVADRAVKRLKDVWAVIDGGMWQPGCDKLPRIILTCCILHNIMIDVEGEEILDEPIELSEPDLGYPLEKSQLADEKGVVVRDKLCLYLNGKLPA